MRKFFLILSICFLISPLYGKRKGLPEWAVTHRHPKYPEKVYILGVGLADMTGANKEDLERAKASALSDIASQIEVKIKSNLRMIENEVKSKRGISYTEYIEKRTEQDVEACLRGVQIVITGFAPKEKTAYCLAVLHRAKAASLIEEELNSLLKDIKSLLSDADKYYEEGKVVTAIQSLKKAIDKFYQAESKKVLLNSISPVPAFETSPITIEDIFSKIRRILNEIEIEKVSGDNQEAEIGRNLPEPLCVKVTAKGKPIHPIEVTFSYAKGGKIGKAITDKEGIAKIEAIAKKQKGKFGYIIAKIEIPGLPDEFLDQLDLIKVKFTYSIKGIEYYVGIRVRNKEFASAIKEALTKAGVRFSEKARCYIKGEIGTSYQGKVTGFAGDVHRFEAKAIITLIDRKTGGDVKTWTIKATGTDKDRNIARRKALENLFKKIVKKFGKDFIEDIGSELDKTPDLLKEM